MLPSRPQVVLGKGKSAGREHAQHILTHPAQGGTHSRPGRGCGVYSCAFTPLSRPAGRFMRLFLLASHQNCEQAFARSLARLWGVMGHCNALHTSPTNALLPFNDLFAAAHGSSPLPPRAALRLKARFLETDKQVDSKAPPSFSRWQPPHTCHDAPGGVPAAAAARAASSGRCARPRQRRLPRRVRAVCALAPHAGASHTCGGLGGGGGMRTTRQRLFFTGRR